MKPWYSPRGARRGLKLAAVAAVLWSAWALGFLQGSARPPTPAAHEHLHTDHEHPPASASGRPLT